MYRRRLPHWRAEEAVYFVTWRLHKTQPELSADERAMVAAALRNFDLQRYRLVGYVVMNDHVHVVVEPCNGYGLSAIVQSWKSYTANRFQRLYARSARVWQREYFDRVIRDEDELCDKLEYIMGNHQKRWPDIENYPWVWVAEGDL
ncbi:MAG: transposase [Candidatus Binataceae bacterium]